MTEEQNGQMRSRAEQNPTPVPHPESLAAQRIEGCLDACAELRNRKYTLYRDVCVYVEYRIHAKAEEKTVFYVPQFRTVPQTVENKGICCRNSVLRSVPHFRTKERRT